MLRHAQRASTTISPVALAANASRVEGQSGHGTSIAIVMTLGS
jgi:hypothetical protein